jgi:hypothetical protein
VQRTIVLSNVVVKLSITCTFHSTIQSELMHHVVPIPPFHSVCDCDINDKHWLESESGLSKPPSKQTGKINLKDTFCEKSHPVSIIFVDDDDDDDHYHRPFI